MCVSGTEGEGEGKERRDGGQRSLLRFWFVNFQSVRTVPGGLIPSRPSLTSRPASNPLGSACQAKKPWRDLVAQLWVQPDPRGWSLVKQGHGAIQGLLTSSPALSLGWGLGGSAGSMAIL